MASRQPCTCEYCEQHRRQIKQFDTIEDPRKPDPVDLLGLTAAIILPLLAILGVVAAWWVEHR